MNDFVEKHKLEMAGMVASTEQHISTVDEFMITDSSGRIVYDGTLKNSDFRVKTDENGVAVMVAKQGHVHAHLMAQYAEDAKATDKPWELWQSKDVDGDWVASGRNPIWRPDTEYRRKPKTHTVNGVEIPDLRFVPKENEEYYLPDPLVTQLYLITYFSPQAHSHRKVSNLCYEPTEAGKQAAIAHAKAWLGIA